MHEEDHSRVDLSSHVSTPGSTAKIANGRVRASGPNEPEPVWCIECNTPQFDHSQLICTDCANRAVLFGNDYLAGAARQQFAAVAFGAKPCAVGNIRPVECEAFAEFFAASGFADRLQLAFGLQVGLHVEWRVARESWCLEALAWLSTGGRDVLGDYHLHWVQGLLFGYAPDVIGVYLKGKT